MAVSMSGNKPTLLGEARVEAKRRECKEEYLPKKVRMRLSYNGTCDTLLPGVSRNDTAEHNAGPRIVGI